MPMFLFLFFVLAQAAVFFYLRNHSSFTESKWTFLLLETIVVFATVSWYLLAQKNVPSRGIPSKNKASQNVPSLPSKHPEEEKTHDTLSSEISSLKEALSHLSQAEESSKKRIEQLEQERSELKEKLQQEESLRMESLANIERYGPLVYDLSLEIEKLTSHLDEIKKHHAIEVRALLGKEERSAHHKASSSAKPCVVRQPTSPLASALLLLVQCHKGISLSDSAWPAQEHALLVRRKFFDLVSSCAASPLAVLSLTSPSDHFLSPKMPGGFSLPILQSLITPHTKALCSLRPFEPYFILTQQDPFIVFRLAWNNLDDLVAIVPHTSPK